MPVEQLVKSKAQWAARKTMGSYGNYAYQALKKPISQVAKNVASLFGQTSVPQTSGRISLVDLSAIPTGGVYKALGCLQNDGRGIPNAYKVAIASKALNKIIYAVKQDKTAMSITSNWSSLIPRSIGAAVERVTQLAGVSFQTSWTTRRIWTGTSPIDITLKLVFESVEDTVTNVIAPCRVLMQMAAPRIGGGGAIDMPGINASLELNVIPPGPSPYIVSEENAEEQIIITIGNYLIFDSVVLVEVSPVFDTRLDAEGYPIRAEVDVRFQTYQAYTKEAIGKAFQGRATGV